MHLQRGLRVRGLGPRVVPIALWHYRLALPGSVGDACWWQRRRQSSSTHHARCAASHAHCPGPSDGVRPPVANLQAVLLFNRRKDQRDTCPERLIEVLSVTRLVLFDEDAETGT